MSMDIEKKGGAIPRLLDDFVIPSFVRIYISELKEKNKNGDAFYLHGSATVQFRMSKWLLLIGIIEPAKNESKGMANYLRQSVIPQNKRRRKYVFKG